MFFMKFGSQQFLLVNLKPINKNIHKNKKKKQERDIKMPQNVYNT